MTKQASPKYAPEVRERAVRMVFEHEGEHVSQWAAISSIAAKIGCTPETLRGWVRQAERDQGKRPGPTTDEQERIKALERENRELRQANEILRKASAYFCSGGARPPVQEMIAFIDAHRAVHGVEPILPRFCRSPRRPTAPMPPGRLIRPRPRPAHEATRS
ncbi:Transposase [Azospirillum oryzae]|uniref:Transposase n=1 Tax=Azospirillum oryzae TaxID=286727 RepID=A0A1X7HL08_9PROT|nr:Transposase [Azospirillum oryzae]